MKMDDFFWTYILLLVGGIMGVLGAFYDNMPYFFCGLLIFSSAIYTSNRW